MGHTKVHFLENILSSDFGATVKVSFFIPQYFFFLWFFAFVAPA